ncbi:uncharacterized protein LOC129570551 isoform X4 [Sitodiplosis mosellana]|nr:uncharacterized protein LOC129570551 isoform X4 [Sitodiplosis mosellana]
MNSTTSWKEEMDKMLAGCEQQIKQSLVNMKMSARHTGLQFNPEFKDYFLAASNNRIKAIYERFEVDLLEERVNGGASPSSTGVVTQCLCAPNNIKMERKTAASGPIEISDSTDDEDTIGSSNGSPKGDQTKRSTKNGSSDLTVASSSVLKRNEVSSSESSEDEPIQGVQSASGETSAPKYSKRLRERPYRCKKCKMYFTRKENMKKHSKDKMCLSQNHFLIF